MDCHLCVWILIGWFLGFGIGSEVWDEERRVKAWRRGRRREEEEVLLVLLLSVTLGGGIGRKDFEVSIRKGSR